MKRHRIHFPLKLLILLRQTPKSDDAFPILFHTEIIVDMAHGLNHEPDSTWRIRLTLQSNIGMFLKSPVQKLEELAVDCNEAQIMGLDHEGVLETYGQFDLVNYEAEIEHFELSGLVDDWLLGLCGRLIPFYVVKDAGDCCGLELWNCGHWDGLRDGWDLPTGIFHNGFTKDMKFLGRKALLTDGSIVVIACQLPREAHFLDIPRVGPCCKPKASPPMGHVHGIGQIMRHQELKLFNFILRIFFLKFLHMPESKPSTVDLSTEDKPSRLECSLNVIDFKLSESIVESYVSALPMAFPHIDEPIHIVFRGSYIEISPQCADCLNIIDIRAEETVFVFDLKHYYTFFRILGGPKMLFYDRSNCGEVYLDLLHEIFVQGTDFELRVG